MDPVGPKPRALVVDDNVEAADALAVYLRLSDFEVETAYNGTEGFALARALSPDVIFLDIGLPDVTGLTVAKWIRTGISLGKTVIVATSAYSPDMVSTPALDSADFDYYFVKPFDCSQLQPIIDAVRVRHSVEHPVTGTPESWERKPV